MPIRFHCRHCDQLLSIARRKGGRLVDCPTCGKRVVVPLRSEARRAGPSAGRTAERADWEEAARGRDATLGTPGAPVATQAGSERLWRRRRGQDSETEEEFDLTPMIDVTFQLLIFFLLTASFAIQKTFRMPHQDTQRQGARQALRTLSDVEKDHVVVRVAPDNSIWVDEEKTPVADLVARIRSSVRSTGRTEMLIAAHDRAWHETVVHVMDAASAVGIERVRLAVPAAEEATTPAKPR